jgi:predicted lipid-binding transport protein (Tim44 family)
LASVRVLGESTAMAKNSTNNPAPPARPNRWLTVMTGVIVGAIWGVIMWGINAAIHHSANGTVFLYIVLTMAMIGGGVAAFFGAVGIKRSGESLAPRLRRRGK